VVQEPARKHTGCSSTRWMARMLAQLDHVLTNSCCVGASRCRGGFLPSGAAVALSPLRGAEWASPTRTDCTSKRRSRSGGRTAAPDSRSSFKATDTGHSMRRINTVRKHSVPTSRFSGIGAVCFESRTKYLLIRCASKLIF
jgi:hypothetical protein